MTLERSKYWTEGQAISRVFYQYSQGRDSALRPSPDSIDRLSRGLDLNRCYIRKCLSIFNYEV